MNNPDTIDIRHPQIGDGQWHTRIGTQSKFAYPNEYMSVEVGQNPQTKFWFYRVWLSHDVMMPLDSRHARCVAKQDGWTEPLARQNGLEAIRTFGFQLSNHLHRYPLQLPKAPNGTNKRPS